MSETEDYVQGPIPLESLTPMVLAREPEREEPTPIESSPEALHEAAESRIDAGPEADVIIFRDSETGRVRPPNETVSAEQAAREIAAYRNANEDAREQASDDATRNLIDSITNNALNPDLQPQVQQAHPEQQQAQPQHTEAQPAQVPEGIDPDVARVLSENPKVRELLQAEVQQVHTAHQSLVDATRANANMAVASLMAAFPEVANVPADQIRGAIQVIAQQDPAKAAAIVSHIRTVEAQVAAWQQLETTRQADAQRQYQKQFAEYAKAEDAKAEKLLAGVDSKKLSEAAVSTLKNLGFSDSDLARAWTGDATISLRDHRAQVLLAKAALYDQAQAGLHSAARAPAPPVMRPGVSGARADEYSQSELSGLTNRLNQSGNVKDAARLLGARRANRG